jgi:hypothetical protein
MDWGRSPRSIYTVRQKLSTTWFVSIISFLIMNLFQIGLLILLPVHTYLLTYETGYWSIFIYVYIRGCGGGGVTVWGCFSFDCKLDLYVLDGNRTGQKYHVNVLAPRVVPHFNNHALADRPMFMDDNAKPHRALIVQPFYSKRLFRQFHGLWCRQSEDSAF